MKKHGLFVAAIFLLTACQNSESEKFRSYSNVNIEHNETTHPGQKMMETYCYACHGPTASQDERLAPPMIAVKKHYITESTPKAEFIFEVQNWVKDPSTENAKMYGAVRRFGVMPKLVYPENIIEQIADYIYDHDIEEPEWFDDHFKTEKFKQRRNGFGRKRG